VDGYVPSSLLTLRRSRGKVFVFTGILPIMKDEDGVAAVLGHEISHTVAKHTAERASRGFIVVGIALLLSAFIDVSQQLSGLLLSLGYEMPNTRVQEVCCLLWMQTSSLIQWLGGGGPYWTAWAIPTDSLSVQWLTGCSYDG
jgi:Zn-dependent protease with chaperone function